MTRRLIMAAMLAACAGARADEWSQMIGQNDQVTIGRVAYWSMRNSGTTVFDEWGGYNGVATNGVAFGYEFGVVNDGARFDGTNDAIVVASSGALENATAGDITVSLWFFATGLGEGGLGRLFDKTLLGPGDGYLAYLQTGTGGKFIVNFTQAFSSAQARWITDSVFNFTNWTHFVIQYNGSTTTNNPTVFVNGTAVSVNVSVAPIGTKVSDAGKALYFGGRVSGTRAFDGQIDEIMFFTRTLSPDEIRQLYRMGATPRRIKE
jgi:hypothetical protein